MSSSVSGITTTISNVSGTTYLDGLASGLDTTGIIDKLAEIQSKPVKRLEARKTALQRRLAAYQSINASLGALQLAAWDLATPSQFLTRGVTVSGYTTGSAPLAASASSAARTGTHQVVVEQLAQAQRVLSGAGAVADADAALNAAGDLRINGKTVSLTAGDTLKSLRDKINAAGAGVSADVLQVAEGDARLVLTARQPGVENSIDLADATQGNLLQRLGLVSAEASLKHPVAGGASAQSDGVVNSALDVAVALGLTIPPAGTVLIAGVSLTLNLGSDSLEDLRDRINQNEELQAQGVSADVVSEQVGGKTQYRLQIDKAEGTLTLTDDNNVLSALGLVQHSFVNEQQAACDARIRVDGVTVTRSTNSMDDVLDGLSIELTSAAPTEKLTLTVAQDTASAARKVQSFVSAYNSLIDQIASAQAYDTETQSGGVLFGDAAILNLEYGLRATISNPIPMSATTSDTLASIGISTDAHDRLVLDTAKLTQVLTEDPGRVERLFGLKAEADTAQIEFVSATRATAASDTSGYLVHITQAAQRGTASSREYAAGATLTAAETLTFDGTSPVTLEAGMTLQQAADRLNGWFRTYGSAYEATVVSEGGHEHLQIQHEQYGAAYAVVVSSSLADGVGGTGLGGATAGSTETYWGKDVAGTINGEAATGKGQVLTGDSGNATTDGLALKITATDSGVDLGRVSVNKGAARRLSEYISFALDAESGSITQGAQSLTKSMASLDDDIETVEERVQRYRDKMQAKFQAMETALARAQALQQYMSGQISAFTSSKDS